jgi:hypothetical protein
MRRSASGFQSTSERRRPPGRRITPLRLELLEDRCLLATLTVTSNHDHGTGTLRWAITEANSAGGDQSIVFDPGAFATPQTITLDTALPFLSDTTGLESIAGPTVGVIITRSAVAGTSNFCIINIGQGVAASLSSLTLTNGDDGPQDVGGLVNFGVATLSTLEIVHNTGSGITNDGILTVSDSTIEGNASKLGGGGVFNQGTLSLTDCTVSGNSSATDGGAISSIGASSTLTLTNCTLSGNSAVGSGGSLFLDGGSANLVFATVSGNTAESAGSGAGTGGGIANGGPGSNTGSLTLTDALVAGNTTGTGSAAFADDINGLVVSTSSYNLIGVDTGLAGISNGVKNNQIGTASQPIDAHLAPLGDYGGATATQALGAGSPAIKTGTSVAGILSDQRGFARGPGFDVGAFQASGYIGQPLIVNTTADVGAVGQLALRQAINLANMWRSDETIEFDPGVFATPRAITLSSALPDLNDSTGKESIVGPSVGVTIARSAAAGTPYFRIITLDGLMVALSNLTITGGTQDPQGLSVGGGILNVGVVDMTDCTVSGNSAQFGAGLFQEAGDMTLTDCTVSGNSAQSGAGLFEGAGNMTLTDCTISGNFASGGGGGLSNGPYGLVSMTDCTIRGNSAGAGGGVYNTGVVNLTDCTVSGNSASLSGGAIENAGPATLSSCLITSNSAGESGGGILNHGSALDLRDCSLSGNSAVSGGGIANFPSASSTATLRINDSSLTDNSATDNGGGIDNGGSANLNACLLGANSALLGGGIVNEQIADLVIVNSTVSGNTTRNLFSGTLDTYGGASLTDCTISANTGGGISVSHIRGNGNVSLTGTIVAGDSPPDFASDLGSFTGDHNLIGGDPMLAPLGDYGGATETMPPLRGSPALGAGAADARATTDQRGFPRNGPIDIGAFQATGNSAVTVNSLSETGHFAQFNLRQAINLADAAQAVDTVVFDPRLFPGPTSIPLNSPLPPITARITIDGRSVETIPGTPNVVLDGIVPGNTADGLVLTGGLVTIAGLEITDYGTGVLITSPTATADTLTGDRIVNNGTGVRIDQGASSNIIGGTSPGAGNDITGNGIGIVLSDKWTTRNLIAGNLIGMDPSRPADQPNPGPGILIENVAHDNQIGAEGAGNIIAFNEGPGGVVVDQASAGNIIRYNQTYGNFGPGIAESAGNDNSPFPSPPALSASTSPSAVTGTIFGAPDSQYTLDFYANRVGETPDRPQGRDDLGALTVSTDSTGHTAFDFTFTPIAGEPVITATSTGLAPAAGGGGEGGGQPPGPASGFISTSPFSAPVDASLIASPQTLTAIDALPFQGSVAAFAADAGATAASFSASIEWGDGQTSAGTVVAGPGGFLVSGNHTYSQAASELPVIVTLLDLRNSSRVVIHSLVSVAPFPLVAFAQTAAFTESQPSTTIVASFRDSDLRPFASQFAATIDWGDHQKSTGTVSADGTGFDVLGQHTYIQAGSGSYPIAVTILDTATGATVTASSLAQVAPVPLTLVGRNFSVTGNKHFSGVVAALSDGDPRIDPTFYTATITWDDGTKTTGTISGANPFTIKGAHTFGAFIPTHLITVTVTDKLGRTVSAVDRVVDPAAHSHRRKAHPSASRSKRLPNRPMSARFPGYLVLPR